jgi:hypothetical protein
VDHATVRKILEKVISSPASINLPEFDEAIRWVERRGTTRQLDRGTDRDVYSTQFEAAAVEMRVLRQLLAHGWFSATAESAHRVLTLLGREISLPGMDRRKIPPRGLGSPREISPRGPEGPREIPPRGLGSPREISPRGLERPREIPPRGLESRREISPRGMETSTGTNRSEGGRTNLRQTTPRREPILKLFFRFVISFIGLLLFAASLALVAWWVMNPPPP